VIALAVALALGAAPGCPAALAEAAALPDERLAAAAPELVARLEAAGAGGPSLALAAAAEGADGPPADRGAAFRGALARHCALAALPARPPASAEERAVLAGILAGPELRRARIDPRALRQALLGLWDRVLALLGTAEAGRYAAVGRTLFLAGAVVAGLLALVALRRRRPPPSPGRPLERPARPEPPDDPAARTARAEAALARGDGRAAVREALLAALAALERAGRVPRGRALTNRELVAAAPPPLSADLAALATAFDRAVYGARPVAAAEARGTLDRARSVVERARGGGR